MNAVVPGRPQIMVLASPAAPGSYRGFAYEAIAISFDNADVVKALEISAFDGSAESYIIHADGRVVVDNAPSQEKIYNFLAALKKSSDLDDGEIAGLQEDFRQGSSGAALLRMGETDYYLIYEAAEVDDWVMIGLVPVAVVNASMERLQSSTLVLASGITVSLALLMLVLAVRRYRRTLRSKDREILYRDELFSKLSTNVNDVFLMLDARALRVDYICGSP